MVVTPTPAIAGPGDPDRSFGKRGEVVTDFDAASFGIADVAVDSHERVVALGRWVSEPTARVVRYRRNGKLDPGFGRDGVVTHDFPTRYARIQSVAVDSADRVVVGGFGIDRGPRSGDMFFARFLVNGKLDPSFGEGGVAIVDITGLDVVDAITVDNADRVIGAGQSPDPDGSNFSPTVVRLTEDGALDSGFAEQGVFTADELGSARDVAVDSAGRLVLSGVDGNRSRPDAEPWIRRLDPAGAPDPSFADGGFASSRGVVIKSLALDSADRPLLATCTAGKLERRPPRFEARRLTVQGRPDRSFGAAGHTSLRVGKKPGACAGSVVVDGSDRVIIGGGIRGGGKHLRDFGLLRLRANGSRDRSFGTRGVATTDFGRSIDQLNSLALGPSGLIVAAGLTRTNNFQEQYALSRYLP